MSTHTKQAEEFKNKNITVQLTRNPGCLVTLDIAVTPEATVATQKKAIKEVSREVLIPGFRKGHAPAKIILDKYGKYVTDELNKLIVNVAYEESTKLSKTYPMSEKAIKKPTLKSVSLEHGSNVIIEFETLPILPKINPKELVIEKTHPAEVTTKMINDKIDELKLNSATWEDAPKKTIEPNDFVRLTFENTSEPSIKPQTEDHVPVKEDAMPAWLYNFIIGKDVGFTGTVTHPENESATLKVTIEAVQTPILPAMDTSFFEKFGTTSEEDLIAKIRAMFEKEAKDKAHISDLEKLEAAIDSTYDFDLPQSFFEFEKKRYITGMKQESEAKKQDLKDLEEEAAHFVKTKLKVAFIASHIASENKFSVSNEEFSQALFQEMMKNGRFDKDIDDNTKRRIYSEIIHQKGMNFLLEHATVKQ